MKKPYLQILLVMVGSVMVGPSWEEASNGFYPFAYKHVVILNEMTTGTAFDVQCRTKGKDLGKVTIPYGGTWGFKFHVNFLKTTKYTCDFTWPGVKRWFLAFVVWRDDDPLGDFPVCRECIWAVASPEIGPCRIRRDGLISICFRWNVT